MAEFKFTVEVTINARNEESALKKLAKALYGGRSHFDEVGIHAENIQENGQHTLGPGSMPGDSLQWDALVDYKRARVFRPKSLTKMEAKRRELLDEIGDDVAAAMQKLTKLKKQM